MKSKKKVVSISIIAVVAVALIAIIILTGNKKGFVDEVPQSEVDAAFELLNSSLSFETTRYQDYIAD